jgi:spore germination protein KC
LCGCWNYREIDAQAIVAGIAIDKDNTTNKYIVTTEIVTAQAQGASSNFSSELYSFEGDSIFSAVRSTIEKTGLRLFWSDAKVVILSESIAGEGVIPVFDWINRSHEIRADIWVLIAKGNSASEILKAKVKLNEVVSFHLNETMMSANTIPKFVDSRLIFFIQGISAEGNSETAATVKVDTSGGIAVPLVEGSAVFKGDKLIGYIDGCESLYLLMIKNRLKEGLITLKNALGSESSVTLEIYSNKTKLTPVYNNGKASIKLDIYSTMGIEEIEGTKDFMEEKNLKLLQVEAEKKIETEIQKLIKKMQKDYNSDIFGFGEAFMKEKPKVSKNFKKSGEDIFGEIKTEVNVHIQIKGSGEISKPITIGK